MSNNNYILTADGKLHTVTDDALCHYGVIGMKWGIRRSRKFAEKAKKAKTSEARKKYQDKSDKIAAYHERMSGGKNVMNRVKSISTGKAIAQSLVFGTYGAVKYNAARSKNLSRGRAAAEAAAYQAGNYLTTGILQVLEPRLGELRKRQIVDGARKYING